MLIQILNENNEKITAIDLTMFKVKVYTEYIVGFEHNYIAITFINKDKFKEGFDPFFTWFDGDDIYVQKDWTVTIGDDRFVYDGSEQMGKIIKHNIKVAEILTNLEEN